MRIKAIISSVLFRIVFVSHAKNIVLSVLTGFLFLCYTSSMAQVQIITPSGNYCSGKSISLNITGGTAPYNILYYIGGTPVMVVTPASFTNPYVIAVNNPSQYAASFSIATVTDMNTTYLQVQSPPVISIYAVPSVAVSIAPMAPPPCPLEAMSISSVVGQQPLSLHASDGTNTWNFTNITSNTSSIPLPGGKTYTITTVTDANNCSAPLSTLNTAAVQSSGNLILNPSAAVSATCNYTLTLTNPKQGYQYEWFKDGMALPGVTQPYTSGIISYNVTQTGNYYVLGIGIPQPGQRTLPCPEISAFVPVTIANTISLPATPSISVPNTGTLTCGQKIVLTVLASKQYDVYTWKKDGDIIPTESSSTLTVSSQGSYQVSVTDNSAICGGSDFSPAVNVVYAPPASFQAPAIAGNTSFTCGQTTTLSVNPVYDSYQWLLNSVEIAGATSASAVVTQAGNYTVRVTQSCSEALSAVYAISVNPIPVKLNYAETASINFNSGLNVATEISGFTFDGYQWQTSQDDVTFTDIPGATQSSYTFASTNYYRLKATKGTCISYSEYFYPVIRNTPTLTPDPNLTPGFIIMCTAGAKITAPAGFQSYQWYNNNVLIAGETGNVINLSKPGLGSGNYTVFISEAYGLVSVSNTLYVIVMSDITPVLQVQNPACSGQSGSITVQQPTGRTYYQSYIWKDQQGNVVASGPVATVLDVVTPGTYSVSVTDYAGCTATASATVTAGGTAPPDFTPTLQIADGVTTRCLDAFQNGIAISVSNISSLPPSGYSYAYIWYKDGQVMQQLPTFSQPSISLLGTSNFNAIQSGTYTLQIMQVWNGYPYAPMPQGWKSTVCIGISNSLSVTVYPFPNPTVVSTYSSSQCPGSDVTVSATGTIAPGSAYTWNFGTATIKSIPGTGTGVGTNMGTGPGPFIITYPAGGNYQVIANISATGCPTITPAGQVKINAPQYMNVTSPQPSIFQGCTAQLYVITTITNLSDWTPAGTVTPVAGQPSAYIATPKQTTTYSITGTDVNNCQNTKSITIQVTTPPDLSFGYAQQAYCQKNYSYVTPAYTGSANIHNYQSNLPGLQVNSYTGGFTPNASTSGLYSISNSMPATATCPAFGDTVKIRIDKATTVPSYLSYGNGSGNLCTMQGNISPLVQGASDPGIYTFVPVGTSPATGLVIDASTGIINSSTSLPGTYKITFTVASNGTCAGGSVNTTVTLQSQNNPAFSYSQAAYCLTPGIKGTIVPVTASPNQGLNGFSVLNNSGFPITNKDGTIDLSKVTGSAAGTSYTIVNTYYSNASCPAITSTEVLTFSTSVQAAAISYSSNNIICEGNAISIAPTITAPGTAGAFSASPAAGITLAADGTIKAVVAGTYIITNFVKAGPGCTDSYATCTLTVKPKPVLTVTGADNICTGTMYTPAALSTTPAGTTYTWTTVLSSGTVTGFTPGSGTTIAQKLTGNGTVNYTIIPTLNGCTGSTVTIAAQVNPIPVVSATATSACAGDVFSIPLQSTVAGSSFNWSRTLATGLTGYPVSGTGSPISGSAAGNGTITYSITATAAGCISAPQTVVLTINPYPVPSSTVSPAQVCPGGTIGLSVSTTSDLSGTTYTYPTPTGFTIVAGSAHGGPTGFGVSYTVAAAGTLNVIKTYKGCAITTSYPVSLYTVPVIQASPATICEGNGFTVPLNASESISGYTWSVASKTGTVSGYMQSGTAAVLSAAAITGSGSVTYTVQAVSANNCTSAATPVTITVNPKPVITISSGGVSSVCIGNAVSLQATGALNYVWSTAATPNLATTASVTGIPSAATVYQVTGTDANGCSAVKSINIGVWQLPAAPVSPSAQVTRCGPGTITLTATSASGTTIKWYDNFTAVAPVGTGPSLNYTLGTNSNAFFVTAIDANGCENIRYQTIVIGIPYPIPVAPAGSDESRCGSGTMTLSASGADASSAYEWYASAADNATAVKTAADQTDNTYTPNITATTDFYVSIYNTYTQCRSPKTEVTATLLTKPLPPTNPNNPVTCTPGSLTYSVDNVPGYYYTWYPCSGGCREFENLGGGDPYNVNTYVSYIDGTDVTNPVTLWVDMFDPVSGCISDRTPVTGTYYNIPAPTVPAVLSSCVGYNTQIPVTVPAGLSTNLQYNFYATPDLSSTPLLSSSSPNIPTQVTGTNTYYISVKDLSKGGCASDPSLASTTVTVLPSPAGVTSVTHVDGCQEVTYTAIGGQPGDTYTWYNAYGYTYLQTGSTYVYNVGFFEDAYSVSTTSANGCNSAPYIITPGSPKTIPTSPVVTSANVCGPASVVLTASLEGGRSGKGSVFQWYTDADGTSPIAGATSAIYTTPVLSASADYYVSIVENGCASYPPAHASVTEYPGIHVTSPVLTTPLCRGASAVLTASGGTSYEWYTGSTLLGTGSTLLVSPIVTTTYTVTDPSIGDSCGTVFVTVNVVLNGKGGCFSRDASIDINTADVSAVNTFAVSAAPNPFSSVSTIQVSSSDETVTLHITDMNGTELITIPQVPSNMPYTFGSELASGVYILEVISSSGEKAVLRIVKVK
jgi:hypothetical protein